MGFRDKMKEFGGGDLMFLSEDGEVVTFVVCADPVLVEGKFKGKISERIAVPVVTADGFSLFIMGKRLARKIAKYEDIFETKAFRAIRHGESGDIETSYELKLVDDKDAVANLQAIRHTEYKPELVAEALESAIAAMSN